MDLALRHPVNGPLSREFRRGLEGTGWESDFTSLREDVRRLWVNRSNASSSPGSDLEAHFDPEWLPVRSLSGGTGGICPLTAGDPAFVYSVDSGGSVVSLLSSAGTEPYPAFDLDELLARLG